MNGPYVAPPPDVGDGHPGPHHVGEGRTGLAEHRLDAPKCLARLAGDVIAGAVVPATTTRDPTRTAREYPTSVSNADPDEMLIRSAGATTTPARPRRWTPKQRRSIL